MPVGILRLVSGFDHWIKTTFGSFTAWFVKIATLIEGILLIVSFHLFLLFCFLFCFLSENLVHEDSGRTG